MLTLTSPVETWAHSLPVGLKLAALAVATTGLFLANTPLPLAIACVGTVGLYLSCGFGMAGSGVRLLWPLWPFLVIVAVWHGWTQDLSGGAVVILRLVTAVALANFITMTSRLSDMLAVFQRLLHPLRHLGLSPRRLAIAFALVIRFIPVLLDRASQIRQSWTARSSRRPGWRVLVPVTLAALDDADRAAEALRARGGAG